MFDIGLANLISIFNDFSASFDLASVLGAGSSAFGG